LNRNGIAIMIPSGHVDSFARDHLPPIELWPDFVLSLPGLDCPERFNCVVELLD
jgi:2-aminobenzoate-CoA ligase